MKNIDKKYIWLGLCILYGLNSIAKVINYRQTDGILTLYEKVVKQFNDIIKEDKNV